MRRFALLVMPIFSAVPMLIGLYFIYVGARLLLAGRSVGIALGIAGFGAVGFILASAVWSLRRQILVRLRAVDAEEGGG
jgi:hypothetical protein